MKPFERSLSLDPTRPPRPELRRMLYDRVTYWVSFFMSKRPSKPSSSPPDASRVA
jgi:hypothetical protein